MKILSKILIVSLIIMTSSFSNSHSQENEDSSGNNILITGKIEHLSYEGGFYGIVGDDGTQYKPLNLPESYQIENLHVKVIARPNSKKILTHGWGTPIDIIDIERTH